VIRSLCLFAAALLAPMPGLAQTVSAAPDTAPASGLRIRAAPQIDPALWFADGDYPPAALRAEQEGRVGLLLEIAGDGRVDVCSILSSSRVEGIDSASCRLLIRRARFTPALGRDGKPAPDRWNVSIEWKLPTDIVYSVRSGGTCDDCGLPWATDGAVLEDLSKPVPRDDPAGWLMPADLPEGLRKAGGRATVSLGVTSQGQIASCRATNAAGLGTWRRQICPLLRSRARFDPARDREGRGKPVRARWQHDYVWPAPAQ
jgi:TonB family protein